MALPTSGGLTLDQIAEEVFPGFSHPMDFLTVLGSSLIIDKTLPFAFLPKFYGYVDDITFTSSPTSRTWGYQETTSYDVTIIVDSPTCHVDSFPSWITLKDNTNTQINAGDTLYKGGTPSYVLNMTASVNVGVARNGNVVIHLAAAIGNSYQTQSGTVLNIAVYQDESPAAPYLGGFSLGSSTTIDSFSGESCTGISLGSTTVYPVFTPGGTFTTGSHQLQVFVGSPTGTRLYNGTAYMASGVQTSATCGLSRALTSGEVVYIVIGEDFEL